MPLSHLAVVLLAICVPVFAQGLPLEVHNPTSQTLTQEPVTFGVPIPRLPEPVVSLESVHMAVRDPNGDVVPHHYRTLSRWDGQRDDTTKSIKWVQVTFLADIAPHSTAVYHLAGGWKPNGEMQVQSFADRFVVSPKPGTSFTVNRQATDLFHEVIVDNQTIVAAPGGGIRMTDQNGAVVTASPTATYIQEVSTVRTVIVQKGTLSNNLSYVLRYYFHSGRRDVTVDFRLQNNGRYGLFYGATAANKYFDHCHLWLPVVGAGSQVVTPSGVQQLPGSRFEVNQTFQWGPNTTDALAGFSYEERAGSTILSSGNRHAGGINLAGSNGGVTVAVDRFWENFPKAFRVTNDEIEVGLWPEWGNGPEYRGQYGTLTSTAPVDPLALTNYRFEGGRWKTHRVKFAFHTGSHSPNRVAQIAELTNRPIMGRAPGWWVSQTGATGAFMAPKRVWGEAGRDRIERQFKMLWDDNEADFQSSGLGKIGFRKFRQRGGTYGGRQFYGWDSYGDIVWGGGYGGLHYDWPLMVMMAWVRGGNYELYDIARDMAWHRRDYDQNHSTDASEDWRGCQFYEKGWWHGNFVNGQASHNWIHGVLLHYVTTGDEASFEAALEGQDYLLRHSPGNWTGYWGSRILGWSVANLVDLYNYLGDPAALGEARAGCQNFEQLELASGGNGYISNPGANQQAIPWMHSICFKAIARYTIISTDLSFLPVLQRTRDWLASCVHLSTPTPQAQMGMPYITKEYFPPQNGQPAVHQGTNAHHGIYLAETMAISALLWRQSVDVDRAWLLYEYQARFHQKGSGQWCDFDDPNDYSVIAARMMMYPNAESKILGGLLNSFPTYLFMRSWLDGSFYDEH